MADRRFSIAGLLGVVTLIAISFGMIRIGLPTGDSPLAFFGAVVLIGTMGGVISFLIKGRGQVFSGIATAILIGAWGVTIELGVFFACMLLTFFA